MSYKHLSITERELIAIYRAKNCSMCQIANRLKLDNYPIQISYKTIYRAIYAGYSGTKTFRGQSWSHTQTSPPWQAAST